MWEVQAWPPSGLPNTLRIPTVSLKVHLRVVPGSISSEGYGFKATRAVCFVFRVHKLIRPLHNSKKKKIYIYINNNIYIKNNIFVAFIEAFKGLNIIYKIPTYRFF